VTAVRVIETHISWVLLTGPYAYKIKKPVKLDFLDFSTLERRREYCLQELRLNRRLAPQLYLDVVPITGSSIEPRMDGTGTAIEYALRMREFPQEDLLVNRLAQGQVEARHVDAIADALVTFHERAATADPSAEFGRAASLSQEALDNFAAIERLLTGNGMHLRISALKRWTQDRHAQLLAVFGERRDRARIRECHGDLHTGNIALVDDAPAIFDCIEFNAAFRWIDVMSEIAFIAMDLVARGRTDFAYRLLNRYLEGSGDHAGLQVLRYYLVYRAMVRAKIDCIRARQPDLPPSAGTREWQDFIARVALAERFARQQPRLLAITFGPSGSGKSTAALYAAEHAEMIRIRSDVERKRLFGLKAGDSSHSALDAGIYSAAASAQVYDRIAFLARDAIEAGFAVIVDAAFLQRDSRRRFRQLATSMGAQFAILDCRAAPAELSARIEARQRAGSDPSEATRAVLERQQRTIEPLDAAESATAVAVDIADSGALTSMAQQLELRLHQ
jgi:aminoglycoside phosphotransferase family enzyme/predicted kinase